MLKREANMTAYHLAKTTIQQLPEQIWMKNYPISIRNIVLVMSYLIWIFNRSLKFYIKKKS